MNYSKLNELAAKAMGYSVDPDGSTWQPVEGESEGWREIEKAFEPSTCADDALMLINKIGDRDDWECSYHFGEDNYDVYNVFIGAYAASSDSMPLAMTLCALRAAGISESEITAAME